MMFLGNDRFESFTVQRWDNRIPMHWKSTEVTTNEAVQRRRRFIVSSLDHGRIPVVECRSAP